MTLKEQMTADLAVIFDTDEFAETITYTPKGGAGRQIPADVQRDDRLEPYVRGENTATCVIAVKASDVTDPQHGDTFTITNASGDAEVWEFLKEFEGDLDVRKLALERTMS